MYVSSYWRVFSGLILRGVGGALAFAVVPAFGQISDIVQYSGSFEIGVALDDCVGSTKEVYAGWSCYIAFPNGSGGFGAPEAFSGGGVYQSDYSTVSGLPAGADDVGASYSTVQVTGFNTYITPVNNDGAPAEQYHEDPPLFLPEKGFYTSDPLSPCAYGSSPPQNDQMFPGYTNTTSSPQTITATNDTGVLWTDTLQPGQGIGPQFVNYSVGTTAGVNVSGNNSEGQAQNEDTGVQDVTGNYTNGVLTYNLTNDEGTFSPIIGADGLTLATGSNGPIIWSSIPTTNQGEIDEAGFSDIANNQIQQEAQWSAEMTNLLAAVQNQHGSTNPVTVSLGTNSLQFNGASNVWVENWPSNYDQGGGSNVFNGASNVWVQNWPFTNNPEAATNAILSMYSQTGLAYNVVAPLGSSVSAVVGGVPSSLTDYAGGADEQDVEVGSGDWIVTYPFLAALPAGMASPFTTLRSFVGWVVILVLVIWNFITLFNAIQNVLHTQGAQGPDTGTVVSAFGGNVGTALIVAATIISLISVLPVVAVAIIGPELAQWAGFGGPSSIFTGAGYDWLSQYVPIWLMVTALGSRIAFYFAVRVLETIFSGVVKMLVGV